MSRTRVLAWCMAAPALMSAAAVLVLEARRTQAPDDPLFTTPFAYSIAEAIERDDVQRAYQFIRAGQDPNAPIAVRHDVLTGGRTSAVPPLLWAVANGSTNSVLMLLGHGAHPDPRVQHEAECLAETLRQPAIAELLRRYRPSLAPPPDEAPRCPVASSAAAPS